MEEGGGALLVAPDWRNVETANMYVLTTKHITNKHHVPPWLSDVGDCAISLHALCPP
jgi:hypothetical protein